MPNECYNCRCTQLELLEFWPEDEDRPVFACDDCAAEQRRIEKLADELAAMPSCEEREAIFNLMGLTVQRLVHLLQIHDLKCDCTKMPQQTFQFRRAA